MSASERTFGAFRHRPNEPCEYITLAFSPLSAPLRSRWRNNGLSADFLGDYVLAFLPDGDAPVSQNHQAEIRHAVAYVANELLENAMKYHEPRVDIPIGINLQLSAGHIAVSATNGIGFPQAQLYQSFVERILRQDAGAVFMRQMEASSGGQDPAQSRLGLLTMIHDYGAQLGWRFEALPDHLEVMTVTTSAILSLAGFPGASASKTSMGSLLKSGLKRTIPRSASKARSA